MLTTDHGSIRVKNGLKVVGDRETNTNLRYKFGKNLAYDPKRVFDIIHPSNYGLPEPNISTRYIFALNRDFLFIQIIIIKLRPILRTVFNMEEFHWKR